jgi:methylmalonyl-CoA mutase N-terminal domain/subunit
VVGVNRFATEAAPMPDVLRIDPALEARQRTRVQHVRATRDDARCSAALAAVRRTAESTDNLVPPIIAAVEAQATVGEIADTMRAIFGEYEDAS